MLKLFRYLKPFRLLVVGVLVFVFLQTLSDLYLPTLMADIVDKGVSVGDKSYIWKIGGFMLLVAAGGGICSVLASYFSAKSAMGFGRDVRTKVFGHVEDFSLQEFDKIGTASLITRTTNDITQVQQVLIMILRMMITAPMMCIGGIIMAISKDAKLSLVFVVVIPVLAGAIFLVVRKGIPLFKAMQVKIDKLNLVLREGLTGIRVIRSFDRISHENKKFDAANTDLTDTAVRVNKIMAVLMPLMMLIMNISTIVIIAIGGMRMDHGNMEIGSLMAFIQYGMQIMFSLLMMSMMLIMIPRAQASAVRINEVLEMIPTLTDKDSTKKNSGKEGYVEFKGVTFSYPGAEQPALSDISFQAGPGEITAIIGGTGAGKSTLVSLIPRFYDVDSGQIFIDGMDVRDMSQEDLRHKIGFVPQKAVLFTGTVAENIRYGREEATDEEVTHAAAIAQASEFIGKMEQGYDSMIAQGGNNVSGGQKQRLSIARALVRRPEVYVFDDSFSALDFKTDAKLRAALKSEVGNATVMLVAQRVSTVMDADRIVVLDEGRIAGIGNHKELMQTCDVYKEIVSSQLSEEEIA
ncbi:ABC transporter ATP-binding protein/permease [Paenibacillus glycanilyticus]|uniref:ABC transporter ATP-binding protein n=1 Tax=Paenibacillus glycanilyticus TaxID=126569 RepID=UPI00203DE0AF|nr:ABC transporter ATP-binding protein [Paenibacillus glycanilyticus]MCM3627115.1 ABC transporter ATP-binding protein/permease [Paenibacillus glycanilyticus]